ncbi:MAG: cobaltochelatase subunit CobN [Desulfobacca sp.]|nr:cobaltochelatase subunit CobN [Desulfobacca sp.]
MAVRSVKIASIMWNSYLPTFLAAAEASPEVELSIFANKEIDNNLDYLDQFWSKAAQADVIFLYWTNEGFWAEVSARLSELPPSKTIVTTSYDPANWGRQATVNLAVCTKAYAYLAEGGLENYRRLLEYLAHQVNPEIPVQDPVPLPWQGLLHPPDQTVYDSVASYRAVYPAVNPRTVGLLFSRHSFTNTDMALERALIEALEAQRLNVLPVFSHGNPDPEAGAWGPIQVARRFFFYSDGRANINALINLHYFFLGRAPQGDMAETGVAAQSVALFKDLNIPVFKPVISYSKSIQEWEEDPQGLTSDVCFGIAMPEFEGCIEPIILACSLKLIDERTDTVYELREVISERVAHIADRVARWVRLAAKPPAARKVVFVFHKNECAGLEASLGGAAGLDSGESVVRLMQQMQAAGYQLENIPASGEELMQTILARKAIAEFRWTTVDEIISKGGHLALLDNSIYEQWFAELPDKARADIIAGWGEPPGREMNGVPPSMVWDGKLVITGLNFGQVNVIMQPKRGCAGPRCDGRVCKILHDPDIPPPHQYIATYMYMDRIFGADVLIHVGTHGNLEWLPGKGAGLSAACWPDIAIGSVPHLYIYNADNPAEGAVAKRRSYATLVDHQQAVMTTAGTYGDLEELEELLNDYQRAGEEDRARAHQLEHLINEAIDRNHFRPEIDALETKDFRSVVTRCHELLSSVRNSQTRIGMHVFGERPQGADRAEVINTILRFDSNHELNTRRLVFDLWEEDILAALSNPGERSRDGKVYGHLLYAADRFATELIGWLIQGEDLWEVLGDQPGLDGNLELGERLERFAALVMEIDRRIEYSDEIGSLLNALQGGHVPAGPSGYISRGRYDVLPSGRNFYNVDPTRIPTLAAYRVGVKLAEALLGRYQREEGRYPETVGLVWLASDIMRADGEQIGQILHLLGARPTWKANGQVDGFEIIDLEELGRARVDVNIRVSGITRDCFPDTVKYVDQVIQAVALRDENPDLNFVRRHLVKQAASQGLSLEDPAQFRRLSFRIFCAQPGVYRAGVNLAVYASAWQTENDLSEVYLFWNGYAYGGGAGDASYGVQAHRELMENLRRVEVTFDKHISDEGDFLNCCGYFSNYGGMTVAAKALSGKTPKTYYGDTRDPAHVTVTDFADEMRRVVRAKLLHPKYIEGMKAHGYKGAGDLSKRIGRVYGFGATTGQVDNFIFDEIAETFVLDAEMKAWFSEVNPWALEEIGRRLLEAESRSIWHPDPELLERLKEAYLDIEARLEDTMGDVQGDFQAGAVEIMTAEDVAQWKSAMEAILGPKASRSGASGDDV